MQVRRKALASVSTKLAPGGWSGQVDVIRQFWLSYSEDLRRLKRVTLAAEYLRACAELNQSLLMGESREMTYLPPR